MTPLPLRYWIGIAVFTVSSFMILSSRPFSLNSNEEVLAEAATTIWQNNGSQRLVLIGNSLLGHGAAGVSEFHQSLSANGLNWQVAKFIKSGIKPTYFVPLLPPLAQSKPDLVLLQLENFYIAEDTSRLTMYRENVSELRRYIQRKLFNITVASLEKSYDNIQCSSTTELSDEQYKTIYNAFEPELQTAAFAPYLAFIATIKAQGGQVVLLEMGRSAKAEQHLGHAKRVQINKIIAQLAQLAAIEVWRFPTELTSQQDYCDTAHLAPSGRQIFMQWLLPRLENKGA